MLVRYSESNDDLLSMEKLMAYISNTSIITCRAS
jgi:hypothetical protein